MTQLWVAWLVVTPGNLAAAAAAKSLQSCSTLCDPIDGSPTGSPIQARILKWVAISFSNTLPQLPSHPGFHRTLIRAPCAIQ